MESSKGRLAMAEAMGLHNERVALAQRRVHDLVNQLEQARGELDAANRARHVFTEAMKGSHRTRPRHSLPPTPHAQGVGQRVVRG